MIGRERARAPQAGLLLRFAIAGAVLGIALTPALSISAGLEEETVTAATMRARQPQAAPSSEDRRTPEDRALDERNRAIDRAIKSRICRGC